MDRDAFGASHEAGLVGYAHLPMRADPDDLTRTRWRILFELTGANRGLLAFEILDDVVVGRDHQGETAPDLDMTILDAVELGVSRQHAILRPTDNHLYVIDLESTNGTHINFYPVGTGRAVALKVHDQLQFGQLNMIVAFMEKVPGTEPGPDTDRLKHPTKPSDKKGGSPTDRLD
jgi:pSer/pThr/pTyr-binding forkhead associated (FHA) protein